MPIKHVMCPERTIAGIAYDGANPDTAPRFLIEDMSFDAVNESLARADAIAPDHYSDNRYSEAQLSLIKGSCLLEIAMHPLTSLQEAPHLLERSREQLEYTTNGPSSGGHMWLEAHRLLADWPIIEARLAEGTGSDGENIPLEARETVRQNLFALHADAMKKMPAVAGYLSALIVVRELLEREDVTVFASTSREWRNRGADVLPKDQLHPAYAIIDDQKVPIHASGQDRRGRIVNRRMARLFVARMVGAAQSQKGLSLLSGSPSDISIELVDWIQHPKELSANELTILDAMSQLAVESVHNAAEEEAQQA